MGIIVVPLAWHAAVPNMKSGLMLVLAESLSQPGLQAGARAANCGSLTLGPREVPVFSAIVLLRSHAGSACREPAFVALSGTYVNLGRAGAPGPRRASKVPTFRRVIPAVP
jgi:hypothetical protein